MAVKSEYEKYKLKKRSLKYPLDKIPEDYFIDDIVLIQDFFYNVFEMGMSVDASFKFLKDFYNTSLNSIKSRMISEGYLTENIDLNELDGILDSYAPKKLKKILKNNGLKVPKSIEDRKALIKSEIPEKIAPSRLVVSDVGKKYYDSIKGSNEIFTQCCSDYFYYQEYYELCVKNQYKSDAENFLDFLDLHHDAAIERGDHEGLMTCFEAKGYYYNVLVEDFEMGLDEILNEFIFMINPIYLSERFYSSYEPLTNSINHNLLGSVGELGDEHIISRFNVIWDDFNFEKLFTTKDDALNYLNQMLKSDEAYMDINKSYSLI